MALTPVHRYDRAVIRYCLQRLQDAGQEREAASMDIGRRFCLHQSTLRVITTQESQLPWDNPEDDNAILENALSEDLSFALGERNMPSEESTLTDLQQRVMARIKFKKTTPVCSSVFLRETKLIVGVVAFARSQPSPADGTGPSSGKVTASVPPVAIFPSRKRFRIWRDGSTRPRPRSRTS